LARRRVHLGEDGGKAASSRRTPKRRNAKAKCRRPSRREGLRYRGAQAQACATQTRRQQFRGAQAHRGNRAARQRAGTSAGMAKRRRAAALQKGGMQKRKSRRPSKTRRSALQRRTGKGIKTLSAWFATAYCRDKKIDEERVAKPVKDYMKRSRRDSRRVRRRARGRL
jgi:hypothetical protein